VVNKKEHEGEILSQDDMVRKNMQFAINLTLFALLLMFPLAEDLLES